MKWFSPFLALVGKDLKVEFRGFQFIASSTSLGVLLFLLMGMALDGAGRLPVPWSAGLLWLGVFFASSMSLSKHDLKDQELGGILGLLTSPVDRSVLFYAKWVSTTIFILVLEIVMSGAFLVILNQPRPTHFVVFALVLLGGGIGLTGVGSFVTGLAARSSMRELLVPMLMFPLAIPLFLGLIRLTMYAWDGTVAFPAIWVQVVVAYLVCFAVLPWLLYESLMEV